MARPTLVCNSWLRGLFLILFCHTTSVLSRNVHNNLLYPNLPDISFAHRLAGEAPSLDNHFAFWKHLEEWAGVDNFWDSPSSDSAPTPSRDYSSSKPSSFPSRASSSPASLVTPAPFSIDRRDIHDFRLEKRDTFTSNVCPISTQTTIFISVDGSSTSTLSTVIGPRPTGIPGDAGTSDGTDPTGGSTDPGTTSGQGFTDKEGLITGLVIVITILLASFCALGTYFYKRRRNARLQRLSSQQGVDAAEIVRRMGSKGLMSLSNPRRSPSSRSWISKLLPAALFGGTIRKVRETFIQKKESRDSQSSELLEWKKQVNQGNASRWSRWSEIPTGEPYRTGPGLAEKPVGASLPPPQNSAKGNSPRSIPEVITSPVSSMARLPTPPPKLVSGRPLSGEASNSPNFVPLVQRRISQHNLANTSSSANTNNNNRNSEFRPPVAIEPVRLNSTPDLHRDTSPRRTSQGEPLSPSAWMAGFGLTAGSNPDPFSNPSYVSSSDHHDSLSTNSHSHGGRVPGSPTSPSSGTNSLVSDRTPRGRQLVSYQTQSDAHLSMVAEQGDLRPDGASDIMSTFGSAFGDRPGSRHSMSTMTDENRISTSQFPRYHPLSDVEEVLTPVADERLSMQPGSLPAGWRELRNSGNSGSSTNPNRLSDEAANTPTTAYGDKGYSNPFSDTGSAQTTSSATSVKRKRTPMSSQGRKSESVSMSLRGGVPASEKSGSISITGTSIVGPPSTIDHSEWDDATIRKQEEDRLFYAGALRPSLSPPGESSKQT